jgi:hypothetical protein
LGHGVAHEIGHLLLNSSAHSPFGLMRGKWDSKDLQRAARGDLLFMAEQAWTMRTEVLRRIGQRQLFQSPACGAPKRPVIAMARGREVGSDLGSLECQEAERAA